MHLTILNLEMSTVASMWRNTAASRRCFSTPKSSMMPLPPCSSTACWHTLNTSSDAKSFTMLTSASASGAPSSTAREASFSSERTAQIFVAISANRIATAWCLMSVRPPCT